MSRLRAATATIAERNLLLYRRHPQSVASAVIAPIVFLLGFSAVMSRTMDAQGVDYAQFLPPAIVVQAMLFAAIGSGFMLATDTFTGVLRRMRTLPIPGGSVLMARTVADGVRGVISLAAVVLVAHVLGFRFEAGVLPAIGFVVVAVVFCMVTAAGCGTIGLAKGDPEATAAVLMLPYLVLLMISTAFVPAESFPSWLEPIVEWSPVSAAVDTLRALSSGGELADPLTRFVSWVVVLGTLFATTASRALRRAA